MALTRDDIAEGLVMALTRPLVSYTRSEEDETWLFMMASQLLATGRTSSPD